MATVTVRDARISDCPAISTLVTELITQHIAPSLTVAGLATLLATMDRESTERRIRDGWLHLVDVHDDDLRGLIVVKPPTHLYHFFVATRFQRSGIGRCLFQLADERTMRATGSPILTVNSSLNAVGAYCRFGFVAHGPVVDSDGVRFQPMTRVLG